MTTSSASAFEAIPIGSHAGVRRTPTQQRSRVRRERVLDAAAAIVDRLGPELVTTGMIAEAARVSVGWLYDYFPNREAVFDAVVARSLDKVIPLVESVHLQCANRPWSDVIDSVIDTLFDFYRTEPSFRVLWFSRFQSAQMIEANRRHDLADARAAVARLEHEGLRLRGVDPEIALHLVIGIIDKGLDLAFRLDPNGHRGVVEETKSAVRAYLGTYAA